MLYPAGLRDHIKNQNQVIPESEYVAAQVFYDRKIRYVNEQKNLPAFLSGRFFCGETGIRTLDTLSRARISNPLRYHSGTSPFAVANL